MNVDCRDINTVYSIYNLSMIIEFPMKSIVLISCNSGNNLGIEHLFHKVYDRDLFKHFQQDTGT